MTIEEIRAFLVDLHWVDEAVTKIMDSIVVIRTDAYNQGWNDAEADANEDQDH